MRPHLLVPVKADGTGTTAILISADLLRTSRHLRQPDASKIWDFLQEELELSPQSVTNLDDLTEELEADGLTWANVGIAIDAFKKSVQQAEAVKAIDARKFHASTDADRMHRVLNEQLTEILNGTDLAGDDLFDPAVGARIIFDELPINKGGETIALIEAEIIAAPNEPGVAVITVKDVDGMLVWQTVDKDVPTDLLRSSNDRRCSASVISAWLNEALEFTDHDDHIFENPFGYAWIEMNKESLEQVQHALVGLTKDRGQSL